ncbi:TlpA family protein disulfide reductase [Mucilaginibacter phyllosphaerae]|uniref:Thiol-disulfide isomerase/thioredoxin n=1 Tax=Mucilaginibacter phyllosphaerae TaxID=1812349 RepID=A0A4Y8A793_9SPHI|nr:TlpA disulfide reductase family protein [Mucilaginibacter phyllosphaerae]MBB3970860.1 thiol-disulfide isomerase/thioredoxin [Mucilaginibacter phyllosphaerae]TEW64205.1 TlpA family protein disulfide reductase [Mucilaginibacter phyllosphaerae]GGH05054.1 hypothetical protein GCM10007352_08620 [Mucilaginibacter phyllosphaerae]
MNHKSKSLIIFVLISLFNSANFSTSFAATQVDTLINNKAVQIRFQYSLDKQIRADFYRNKILVLDFWATWCAPCIAGFPRYNDLSRKYSNSDVIFASITNEPIHTVKTFFKRTGKKLNALKLIDTTKYTMNAFGVLTPSLSQGIPYCVIIDKNNVVRWQGNTFDLSESIINGIIKSKPIDENKSTFKTNIPNSIKPINKYSFFSFNAIKADTGISNIDDGETYRSYYNDIIEFTSKNKPLDDLIELLSNVSKVRFKTNSVEKLRQHVGVDFKIGSDSSRFKNYKSTIFENAPRKNFILGLVGEAFKFEVKVEPQKLQHYELIIVDTTKLNTFKSLNPKHHSYDFDHYPNFEVIGYNLSKITSYLESNTNYIITTNIKDKSLYDLSLNIMDFKTLNKNLIFHGLKLVGIEDTVQLLNITFY